MNGPVFLIGLPGAGKSYWGGRIAAQTGLPLTDTDRAIEAEQGMTVSDLFAARGEGAFRLLEQELLRRIVASGTPAVVACGGGMPCFFDNLQQMKQAGMVIYLKATPEYLADRLRGDPVKRPLLPPGPGMAAKLEALLAARAAFYEQAHHILPVENLSYPTFEEIFRRCTNLP